MNSERNIGFESDGEESDDVYYAEIRRRILVLIEEDEDVLLRRKDVDSFGRRTRRRRRRDLRTESHSKGWEIHNSDEVPCWLLKLWKNGGGTGTGAGTGVFIPRILRTRRDDKTGRLRRGEGEVEEWKANVQVPPLKRAF